MRSRWRRVASWVPTLVVVPLALAGAYLVSEPEEQHPELRRLHPLDVGTTWVYAVFDHARPSGTRTVQVRGDVGLVDDSGLTEAVQVSSGYSDYPGTGADSSVTYMGYHDDSILQYALRIGVTNKVLEPPAPAYRLPVEVGASWSYEGTLGGSTTISYDVTLEDILDVEVGGHTFSECAYYVNEFDIEFADGSQGDHEVNEEWTCPGIGPVRSRSVIEAQDAEVVEELVEFHGVDAQWRAEPAARVIEPTVAPPGTTASLNPERTNAVANAALASELAWSDARDQPFSYGPASDGEVMVVGDVVGDVAATEVGTGAVRWRLALPGPIVAPPVIVGDLVFLADAAKDLHVVDAATGATRWVHHFEDVVSAAPTSLGSSVLVPTDDGRITSLNLSDGEVRWSDTRAGAVRSAPARSTSAWLVADTTGRLSAYSEDGDDLWSVSLEDGLAVGPTVTDGVVVLADDGGIISAFDLDDGTVAWQAQPSHFPSEAFAAVDGVLVSVEDGERLEAFDTSNGDRLWSVAQDSLGSAPVILGDQVVTVISTGHIVVRKLTSGEQVQRWSLPRVSADAELDSDIDAVVVGDTLVIGALVRASENTAALYAYPFTESGRTRGLFLRTDDVRVIGTAPSGVPASVGDTVFISGTDSVLYRSSGAGAPAEPMHTSTGYQPAPAVGQGLVVAQRDDQYVAYSVDDAGGEPLWTFPAVDPTASVRPAIGENAVFLPQYQVGLSAVSLDGALLWNQPLPGSFAPTGPIVLPDGDVIYGADGLTRFDGTTGKPVWSDPGALLPGFPTYDDGVIYADVLRTSGASELSAYDAESGEVLWSVPVSEMLFGGGPVAAAGVVVDVDGSSLARAYGRDGSLLWSVQQDSTAAGAVIIDERVYLMELGRTEDLFDRGLRLSVHDLHTGRFLAAYEPATTPFLEVPVLGVGPDETVLVPNGTDFGALLVMEPAS